MRHPRRAFGLLVQSMALLFSLSQASEVFAQATGTARWTLMIYMDGDNDLESWVPYDIEQDLSLIGSTPDVQAVVLADRIRGYNSEAGDWTGTKLFHVHQGMHARPEDALQDWGERNMGDPQTLVDFVLWTKANYPADHYALVFWDHGWTWRPGQSMWDETSDDALDPDEIVHAMEQAGPVDLVGYDACEQQVLELQATWRNFADVFVASQEDLGFIGFTYSISLAALQANPGMTAGELGTKLAQDMTAQTVAVIALDANWDALVAAVDEWAIALNAGLPLYKKAYDSAWIRTQHVSDVFNKDLYDAAVKIKAAVPDANIQAKSQAVIDAMDQQVVLYERHTSSYRNAHGIGIFWPYSPQNLPKSKSPQEEFKYYRTKLLISQWTHWDEFLNRYVKW